MFTLWNTIKEKDLNVPTNSEKKALSFVKMAWETCDISGYGTWPNLESILVGLKNTQTFTRMYIFAYSGLIYLLKNLPLRNIIQGRPEIKEAIRPDSRRENDSRNSSQTIITISTTTMATITTTTWVCLTHVIVRGALIPLSDHLPSLLPNLQLSLLLRFGGYVRRARDLVWK